MSIASLRAECERLHALAALGGQRSPPWLVGGGTDLIHWNGGKMFPRDPLYERPGESAVELITKHLEPYAGLRVHRKFLPDWLIRAFGDASQVDGLASYVECDGSLVKLRSHGLFPLESPIHHRTMRYLGFRIGAQTFLVAIVNGEIVDAA
jgi:hypothetical protein